MSIKETEKQMDDQKGVESDWEKGSATSDAAVTESDGWINSDYIDFLDDLEDWPTEKDAQLKSKYDEILEALEPDVDGRDWTDWFSDDIVPTIHHEEAAETPFVGDKESLSSLEDEFRSNNPIFLEKIKVLDGQYAAIRRTMRDGNCFYRGFMFSYLDHISETRDQTEVDRIKTNIEQSREKLLDLGYLEFTFKDKFDTFIELLERIMRQKDTSTRHDELLYGSQDQSVSNDMVLCFRYVTAGEMRKRSEFFKPFMFEDDTVDQFCTTSVLPMGEESDHVHIAALSDALGVPIRVVYLDQSNPRDDGANHHDFIPDAAAAGGSSSEEPVITLLYRPGHYDILYPKRYCDSE